MTGKVLLAQPRSDSAPASTARSRSWSARLEKYGNRWGTRWTEHRAREGNGGLKDPRVGRGARFVDSLEEALSPKRSP